MSHLCKTEDGRKFLIRPSSALAWCLSSSYRFKDTNGQFTVNGERAALYCVLAEPGHLFFYYQAQKEAWWVKSAAQEAKFAEIVNSICGA